MLILLVLSFLMLSLSCYYFYIIIFKIIYILSYCRYPFWIIKENVYTKMSKLIDGVSKKTALHQNCYKNFQTKILADKEEMWEGEAITVYYTVPKTRQISENIREEVHGGKIFQLSVEMMTNFLELLGNFLSRGLSPLYLRKSARFLGQCMVPVFCLVSCYSQCNREICSISNKPKVIFNVEQNVFVPMLGMYKKYSKLCLLALGWK
jgi:hypothetical protein